MRKILLAALPLLLVSSGSMAYSLSDHEELTEKALRSLEGCFPEGWGEKQAKSIVSANLWEDKNLINKWFKYSHFYHPEQEFGQLRANSQARVQEIQDRLEEGNLSSRKRLGLIGALIHHFQDMTVPLHVMPVNHFWTDGFEKFPMQIDSRLQFSGCDSLFREALTMDAVTLHHLTALETFHDVLDSSLTASVPARLQIPMTWFWEEGSADDFGSYGVVGNSFGKNWIRFAGRQIRIETSEYRRYKFRRFKSALRVTQLILVKYWLLADLDATR